MVSKTAKAEPQAVPLDEFAAEVARRRAALGEVPMPRNSGKRRTASKKALLKAIEDAGGRW
jgi:hypothetical protein